jgi:hypothetical protein
MLLSYPVQQWYGEFLSVAHEVVKCINVDSICQRYSSPASYGDTGQADARFRQSYKRFPSKITKHHFRRVVHQAHAHGLFRLIQRNILCYQPCGRRCGQQIVTCRDTKNGGRYLGNARNPSPPPRFIFTHRLHRHLLHFGRRFEGIPSILATCDPHYPA